MTTVSPAKDEVERLAAQMEPRAWAALGKENDGPKHRDARVLSLRHAEAALAAMPAVDRLREALDDIPTNWELSHGAVDGDMSETAWQVHRVNGGYNDREWTLIGQGETPSEALLAALSSPEPVRHPQAKRLG